MPTSSRSLPTPFFPHPWQIRTLSSLTNFLKVGHDASLDFGGVEDTKVTEKKAVRPPGRPRTKTQPRTKIHQKKGGNKGEKGAKQYAQCPKCFCYYVVMDNAKGTLRKHGKGKQCEGMVLKPLEGTYMDSNAWLGLSVREKAELQAQPNYVPQGKAIIDSDDDEQDCEGGNGNDNNEDDEDDEDDEDNENGEEDENDENDDDDGEGNYNKSKKRKRETGQTSLNKLFTKGSINELSQAMSSHLRDNNKSKKASGGVYVVVNEIACGNNCLVVSITAFAEELDVAGILLVDPKIDEQEGSVQFSFSLVRGSPIWTSVLMHYLHDNHAAQFLSSALIPSSRDIARVGTEWVVGGGEENESKPLLLIFETPAVVASSGLETIKVTIPGRNVQQILALGEQSGNENDLLLPRVYNFVQNHFDTNLSGCTLVRAASGLGVVGSDGRVKMNAVIARGSQEEAVWLDGVRGIVLRRLQDKEH